MIIRLGPIVLMDSKTRDAYRMMLNRAYVLHQAIWHTDDMGLPQAQTAIKALDADLSAAISRVPASEIDATP